MEKKKMKTWKIILIVVSFIILILIAIITRKAIIFAKLDEKVTEYENNNSNIYIKSRIEFSDYTSEMERFIKDDIDKLVIEKTDSDGKKTKIIQITYPDKRKTYTEYEDKKLMNEYEEKAAVRGSHIEKDTESSYTTIMNFTYSTNLLERILNSLCTNIKTTKIDNKEYYELSSLNSMNFLYDENTVKMSVFIDKETGLPMKVVEKISENGKERENIRINEYKFNTVTDEDIKEPNQEEYKSN